MAACALLALGLPAAAFGALELSVSPPPVPLVAGDTVGFEATVTNTGPAAETDVSLLFQGRDEGFGAPEMTGTSGGCLPFASAIVCLIGTLGPGQSASARASYGLLRAPTSQAVVSVNTTAVGSPYQWDGAVSAKATLTLDLAAQPASITAGNATALTATVKNTGAGPAFGAALRLTLPFGLSAATLPGGCTQAGLALTCALGDLPSQETATRTIPIRPPEIGTYTVIAGASWARPPTVSADTTIGVDAPADPNAGQPSPDPPASPAAPVRRTVSVERVSVGLPGKGRCVRDRVLDVLLRGEPKSATVRVGGAKIRRLTGAKARRPFTLRVPRGARRLTVRISATYADSSVFSATRTWRICARKRR